MHLYMSAILQVSLNQFGSGCSDDDVEVHAVLHLLELPSPVCYSTDSFSYGPLYLYDH